MALSNLILSQCAADLTLWFAREARDLTWRRTTDPYCIWVSEIMLQQTRVDTVERYYPQFVQRFPTVHALASAAEDDVLAAWSGLGYYRRARLLHRGAKYVANELSGILPQGSKQLRDVPGVGPYTAGALASIAFDRPEPLVDGNIARVSSRLRAVSQVEKQDAKSTEHWDFVASLMQHGQPRVLAQALMELGATVCTPRQPKCEACPVRSYCVAYAKNLAGEIPAVVKQKKQTVHDYWALMVCCGDEVLLERRHEEGLLADMWCPPLFERESAAPPSTDDRLAELSESIAIGMPASEEIRHIFTHRIWQLRLWMVEIPSSQRPKLKKSSRLVWMPITGPKEGGVPTVTRKLLSAAEKHRRACQSLEDQLDLKLPRQRTTQSRKKATRKSSPSSKNTAKKT